MIRTSSTQRSEPSSQADSRNGRVCFSSAARAAMARRLYVGLFVLFVMFGMLSGCMALEYRQSLREASRITEQYDKLFRTEGAPRINRSASNLQLLRSKVHPAFPVPDSQEAQAYLSANALGIRLSVIRSLNGYFIFLEQLARHGSSKQLARIEGEFRTQLQISLTDLNGVEPSDPGQVPEIRAAVEALLKTLDDGSWRNPKDLVGTSTYFSAPVSALFSALTSDVDTILSEQVKWANAVSRASQQYAADLASRARSDRWKPESSWDLEDPTYAERLALDSSLAAVELNRRSLLGLTECADHGEDALAKVEWATAQLFADFHLWNEAFVTFARSKHTSRDAAELQSFVTIVESALRELKAAYEAAALDMCGHRAPVNSRDAQGDMKV